MYWNINITGIHVVHNVGLEGFSIGTLIVLCRNFFHFSLLLRAQQRNILPPNHTDPCLMWVRRTLKVCKLIQISLYILIWHNFSSVALCNHLMLKKYAEKFDVFHGFA